MSRFARYCSCREIDPEDVTDERLRKFHAWLDARLISNDPLKVTKDTAVAFNAIIKRAGLKIPLLNTAMAPRYVARRVDTYPLTLVRDVECYLKRLREPDIFSVDGPRRALKSTSLRNIEAHIRQLLDAAVSAGYPQTHFQTLRDLIKIEVICAATNHMIERRGGKLTAGLGNILATVMAIARHYRAWDNRPSASLASLLDRMPLDTLQQLRLRPKHRRMSALFETY